MQYDGEIATFTDSPSFAIHAKNRLLSHFHQRSKSESGDLRTLRLHNSGDNFEAIAQENLLACKDDNPPDPGPSAADGR
jgi:hypothetical protein